MTRDISGDSENVELSIGKKIDEISGRVVHENAKYTVGEMFG